MIKSLSRQENGPQNELINFKSLNLELAIWPPSVNSIWRHVGTRTLLSKRGREFFAAVSAEIDSLREKLPVERFTGRVKVRVVLYPPNKMRRDIDNSCKGILDSMTKSGVWDDDSLVDELTIIRGEVRKGGWFRIEIEELPCR